MRGNFRGRMDLGFNRCARCSLTVSLTRNPTCISWVTPTRDCSRPEWCVCAFSDVTLSIHSSAQTKCWIHDSPDFDYRIDDSCDLRRMELWHALPRAFLLRLRYRREHSFRDCCMGVLVGCPNSWSPPNPGSIWIHAVCLDVMVCPTVHGRDLTRCRAEQCRAHGGRRRAFTNGNHNGRPR